MGTRTILATLAICTAGCGSSDNPAVAASQGHDAGTDSSAEDANAPEGGQGGNAESGGEDSGPPQPEHEAFCSKDAWCWNKPVPAGHDLRAATAIGEAELWASGLDTVMYWDGTSWDEPVTGLDGRIVKLWGLSSNDMWGAGFNGGVYRFNGTYWSLASSGTSQSYYGIWGADAKDVWFVGKFGVAENLAGTVFALTSTGTTDDLNDVWGSRSQDVWAVGTTSAHKGFVIHWNGSQWEKAADSLGAGLVDIHGNAADNAWAVGPSSTVARWDGNQWSQVSGAPAGEFVSVVTNGPGDVWIADAEGKYQHWDGDVWKETVVADTVPTTVAALAATPGHEVISVGEHGMMRRFDGTKWAAWPEDRVLEHLYSIWGFASDDLHVVGDRGVILHGNGKTWTRVQSPTTKALRSVWGAGSGDMWAVGDAGTILHYAGGSWSETTGVTTADLKQVFGIDATHVVAVGAGGAVFEWDGTAWKSIHDAADFDFTCVWGDGPDHFWAGGTGGVLEEYSGSGWKAPKIEGLETVTWSSIWGAGGVVLFVSPIIILVHSGDKYDQYQGDTFNPVGLFGNAYNNLWTASLGQGTAHYDGTAWTKMEAPATSQLRSIWVGPERVWAVGDWGTILSRSSGR